MDMVNIFLKLLVDHIYRKYNNYKNKSENYSRESYSLIR